MTNSPSATSTSRRELLRASGVAASAAFAGCAGAGVRPPASDRTAGCSTERRPFPNDWPLLGYDRRNTAANPNATGPTDAAEVRWTDGGHGRVRAAPVVAEDSVFLHAHPNRLVAFDRRTEEKRWTLELGAREGSASAASVSSPGAHSTPTVVGDTVYVGGGNVAFDEEGDRMRSHVHLYAVDRHTGAVRWTVRPDDYVHTAPVVADGTVLFATRAGTIYAVDAERESVAWTVSVGGGPGGVVPTPALADCTLYLATPARGLHAIDLRTRERTWRRPDLRSWAAPAVADGAVYLGGRDGTLYAVDADDGSVVWEYEAGRAIARCSPAVSAGTVYVGDTSGDSGTTAPRVHAVDAATGEAVWTAETREYVKSSPAVADGTVFVGAGPTVLGLDATTGERRWSRETHGWITTPLSVAGGTVFAGTGKGQLYALTEP